MKKKAMKRKRKCEKPKKKKSERSSLRYCCVFQDIIYEEQESINTIL